MKIIIIFIFLYLSLGVINPGHLLAHSSTKNILINNEFLLKEYRGAQSNLFNIPPHYVSKNFVQNDNVNFKILFNNFNKMNLNMAKYCKVMFDNQPIASRDYKIDYPGIELLYEGVEFDITSKNNGSFLLKIDCFEKVTGAKIYFEEIKLDFGPEISFPKVLVINDKEVEFGKTLEYDFVNNEFLNVKFSKYQNEFSFEWDVKNTVKNNVDSIQISTEELEDSDVILAKITHKPTGIVNYGFVRLNKVKNSTKIHEDSQHFQPAPVIALIVVISSIILSVGFVIRKNYKNF